jgi:hypothetical protein
MEAELRCLRAVGTMEERLRNACNAPDATFESVIKVCYWFPFFGFFICIVFLIPIGSFVISVPFYHFVSKGVDGSFSFCMFWTGW